VQRINIQRKEIHGKFEIKPGYFIGQFRALLHIGMGVWKWLKFPDIRARARFLKRSLV
jgi:hypothetical protein